MVEETQGCIEGKFYKQQSRKEVEWPDVPADFDDWTAKKNR